MTKRSLEWKVCYGQVNKDRFSFIQNEIGIKFPFLFIECLGSCNAGVPKKSSFSYYDESIGIEIEDSIGGFLHLNPSEWSNLFSVFLSPPEFFPKNLVAFAETGGGNYICFDYRNDPKTDNPPIVYWNHEAEEGKDVSFIAKDFKEFLSILKESED